MESSLSNVVAHHHSRTCLERHSLLAMQQSSFPKNYRRVNRCHHYPTTRLSRGNRSTRSWRFYQRRISSRHFHCFHWLKILDRPLQRVIERIRLGKMHHLIRMVHIISLWRIWIDCSDSYIVQLCSFLAFHWRWVYYLSDIRVLSSRSLVECL